MDIPVLTEVQIEHFFLADVHYVKLSLVVLDEVTHFDDGSKIHESSCVARVVITIFQVDALIATTHETLVL